MANCVSDIALIGGPLLGVRHGGNTGPGAVVDFRGNVRPLENGAAISGIEYEAHRTMAEHQMRQIAVEAARQFDLMEVILHHAFGFVGAGETSLFLRVAAARRAAAYAASQWIVDE